MAALEQLYTADGSRELDRRAIAGGVPGMELMRRAGSAVFDTLLDGWPSLTRLSICCGKGNNAGDGYVVARLARAQGLSVQLVQLGDPAALAGDAATARDEALAQGLEISSAGDGRVELTGEVIVDALLGTGLKGAARGAYAALIDNMNGTDRPVLAVDVPSGLEADTGAAPGAAVRAHTTVTFIGRKIGLHTGAGVALAGRVRFASLGVGREIRSSVPGLDWLNFPELADRLGLPVRTADAYKQALGHVVVVGGDSSMGGAPLMAAEAALRSGAGLVTVVTRAAHRSAILSRRPEVMVVDADDAEMRDEVLAKATVLVVGPGLGRAQWGEQLLGLALSRSVPMVIDADGLYLLSQNGAHAPRDAVITPHVAEAARLLAVTVAEVNADRPAAAVALAERVAGVAVLKGAGSLVASAVDGPARVLGICAHGNPGMATAGMGDVLAGIIGGLRGQHKNSVEAALLGTCLHGLAADRAVGRLGMASLLATDIFPELIDVLRSAESPGSFSGSSLVGSRNQREV
ncbi:MAG TPA: NAD(P)H-hydrate dehydratase [Pseudomonadales bacterium]